MLSLRHRDHHGPCGGQAREDGVPQMGGGHMKMGRDSCLLFELSESWMHQDWPTEEDLGVLDWVRRGAEKEAHVVRAGYSVHVHTQCRALSHQFLA